MKFVIQRVHQASVNVQKKEIASIGKGLLVLVGIGRGDAKEDAEWMINKVVNMRIFEDDEGKMNRSVRDIKGDLLFIPNFTLYADASKGNRPDFTEAESPEKAQKLYNNLAKIANNEKELTIKTGNFGADMDVSLVNDGPVTIILEK